DDPASGAANANGKFAGQLGERIMRSVNYLPQLFTVFVVSAAAAAQTPWSFPLDRQFVATSINGQTTGSKAPTLTITPDPKNHAVFAAGLAGCNQWRGAVSLGQGRIGLGDLGTTRMYCADQMSAESDFLSAIKAVKHWHMRGTTLVLEGETASLEWAPV